MTILVIFGIPGNFGVTHGRWVQGDNGDRIYFADDKNYTANDLPFGLPGVITNTLLPVIQHSSGAKNYPSQIAWLSREANYQPLHVGIFSHDGEPFNTMKRLLTDPSPNTVDVSKFVEPYSKRMVLQLIDNLAAWHTLCMASNDLDHVKERDKLITKVAHFLEANLFDPDIYDPSIKDPRLGAILEMEAARYC